MRNYTWPFCGSDDGCDFTDRGNLGHHRNLTFEDWQAIYKFMKYVYLPFIHAVIVNSETRARLVKEELTNG